MKVKELIEVLKVQNPELEVMVETEDCLSELGAMKVQSDGRLMLGWSADELDCTCPYCDTLDKEVLEFD